MTLSYIADLATANSVDLRQSAYLVDMQKAVLEAAGADTLPKIDTQYRLTYTDHAVSGRDPLAKITLGTDVISVEPFRPSKYSATLDTSLRQTLYSGGRIEATVALQRLRLEQAENEREKVRQALLSDTMSVFLQYAQSCQETQYLHDFQQALTVKQQNLEQKKAQGLTSAMTDLEASLAVWTGRQDLEKAEKQKQQHYDALTLMTRAVFSDMQPEVSFLSSDQMSSLWQALSIVDRSLDVDLAQRQLDIFQKQQQQVIQDSVFYPEVTLRSGMNYFNVDDGDLGAAGWNLKYGHFYVALQMDWNWFNGFKDVALSRKSQLEQAWSRLAYEQVSQEKKISQSQLALAVELSILRLLEAEKTLTQAQQGFYDKQVLEGDVTPETLLDAQFAVRKSELHIQSMSIAAEQALLHWCETTSQMDRYLKLRSAL